jgi:hypothetical protein
METKSSWSAAVLDDQHVGGVLRQHKPGVHAGALGEEGRQADRECGVGEPVEASFGHDRDHRDAGADHVERQRDRRALEVGAGEHQVLIRQEDRVVGDGVELDFELHTGVRHRVTQRADDLRG